MRIESLRQITDFKQIHFLVSLFFCSLPFLMADDSLGTDEDHLQPSAHEEAIREQKDFFIKNDPMKLLKENRTAKEEVRVSPHFDISQFSDDAIRDTDIPVLASAKRYHKRTAPLDVSRLWPSNSGPTGLLDSISARGLPKSKTAGAYKQSKTRVRSVNLFNNVRNYEGDDAVFILNHGYSDHFELNLRLMKATRRSTSLIGSNFDSAYDDFPEYAYGLKAHQKWGPSEFALGFLNSDIPLRARNLILDQNFEEFKTVYLTMTSPVTYRTESHFTVKRVFADQKFLANNAWYNYILGVDTKLNQKTHLIGEMKYEDFASAAREITFNAALRHKIQGAGLELYVMRGNQESFAESGLKVSGVF